MPVAAIEKISEQKSFGGVQGFYRHASTACAGPMRFTVYQPPQAQRGRVPVLFWLSGLTCTEENFTIKAGAQRIAAELGLIVVAPDTSPRNTGIPGEADDWQFGAGAAFYLDAAVEPWSQHFNMYTYCSAELPELIAEHFPIDPQRMGIFGHSMGGHGALTIALKHSDRFRSVSAFAPIVAPIQVRWGETAFPRFLGPDRETWKQYDATELVQRKKFPGTILIDQGDADQFLNDTLRPEIFAAACEKVGQPLSLRMQPGYDHSYYFVSTFIEDHMRHHEKVLHG
ncbi:MULTISPECIES: S-formylglutathione hydrolase [unclassified Rudaea]|uniref:S-formylglutathione hydrolase n=1 Tax=unclassified Rudaea TaxID=2627037 RepID=UPI0010F698FF|nr:MULTISPECIES: S-formylglutathione hydrolase [unclassified Rudaea]